MNRPNRKPLLNPASLAANGKQGRGAEDGQATSRANHSPANVMAGVLLLHTAIAGAQVVAARLALATDKPPFGLVDAADHLDEAGELIAAIIANGGAQ